MAMYIVPIAHRRYGGAFNFASPITPTAVIETGTASFHYVGQSECQNSNDERGELHGGRSWLLCVYVRISVRAPAKIDQGPWAKCVQSTKDNLLWRDLLGIQMQTKLYNSCRDRIADRPDFRQICGKQGGKYSAGRWQNIANAKNSSLRDHAYYHVARTEVWTHAWILYTSLTSISCCKSMSSGRQTICANRSTLDL